MEAFLCPCFPYESQKHLGVVGGGEAGKKLWLPFLWPTSQSPVWGQGPDGEAWTQISGQENLGRSSNSFSLQIGKPRFREAEVPI